MEPVRRISAKVLLIDPRRRVLLFSGIDRALPDDAPVWFPVGGAVHDGERLVAAAIRETEEETGLQIEEPGPPVATRRVRLALEGTAYDQEESYFLVRAPAFTPVGDGWTELERATIVEQRWWTVEELRRTDATVYPEGLADLLQPPVSLDRPRTRPVAID